MKEYSYEITMKDLERGTIYVHNRVNKARGYGKSSFKTEESARERLESDLKNYGARSYYEVTGWVLTKGNAVIDRG